VFIRKDETVFTINSNETIETCWNIQTDPTMHIHARVVQLNTQLGQSILSYYANDTRVAAYSGTSCAYFMQAMQTSDYEVHEFLNAAPFKLDPHWCSYTSVDNALTIRVIGRQIDDVFSIKMYATYMRLFNVHEIM
jgi:hypothetical protein